VRCHSSASDASAEDGAPHLDVDEQLPQAAWRHHQGCVELRDVAFVQGDVVISREALKSIQKRGYNLSDGETRTTMRAPR